MVWYAVVIVWYDVVWYGVWYGIWYGIVYGIVWYGMVCILWCMMGYCGVVTVVWYVMVWYVMVWYAAVWYDVCYGMI